MKAHRNQTSYYNPEEWERECGNKRVSNTLGIPVEKIEKYGYIKTRPDIFNIDMDQLFADEKADRENAARIFTKIGLYRNVGYKGGNSIKELMYLRSLLDELVGVLGCYTLWAETYEALFSRVISDVDRNGRRHWTEDEDLALIEMFAEGVPTIEVAARLGRSPSAIHTRVSTLVGVERQEMKVGGYFDGFLNDERVQGILNGSVSKNARKKDAS